MNEYKLGVVVPVYNSVRTVGVLTAELLEYFEQAGLTGRVVLVDDGSTDESGAVIERLARENQGVTAARLTRNFGQQSALLCGLALAANCQYIVTMDDDLQHPAEVLDALYRKAGTGYDLVYAIPQERHKQLYRRVGSLLRDVLFTLFTQKPKGVRVGSYRVLSAALAAKICGERQPFVYLSASAFRYAPKTANIPFTPRPRAYGRSGYTLGRLAHIWVNIFRYYTVPGALFRPKSGGAPYEIRSVVPPQPPPLCAAKCKNAL